MALFERPTAHQFNALLRLGFAARLRSETADTFLAQKSATLSRTDTRENAAVLYFVSGDNTSILKPIQTAVLLQHAQQHTNQFLTLAEAPFLSEAPTLLKLQLKDAPNPRRMLFSLCSLSKPLRYLSMHSVKRDKNVRLRDECTKWELFHLEIIPGSPGTGLKHSPIPFAPSYLKVPEAISQALLLLGVRFRLRSAHSRVLHRDVAQDDQIAVLQTGATSDINSSRDCDLVFVPSRCPSDKSVPSSLCFYLKEVSTNRYLAIGTSQANGSCAKLLTEKTPIAVNISGSLGDINLGLLHHDKFHSVQWLMAGPHGRLEMRNDRRSWETFGLEYVQQSYIVELALIPVPSIYSIAEEKTRESLRLEIEAKVAAAKGEAKPSQGAQRGSASPRFDHAAALAGLSDAPKKTPRPSVSNKNKQEAKSKAKQPPPGKPGPTPKKVGSAASKTAAVASASSALPRNKANRKAAKKNKKKQKGKQAKASAARSQRDRAPPSTVNGPVNDVTPALQSEESKKQESESAPIREEPSSASTASSNMHGPKCAACGLTMAGPITKAMGKEFHSQCFCCGVCRRPMAMGSSQFRERSGIPFCNPCYANQIASRCARCSKPIMETVITAMDKTWHKECLTCTICRLPLTQTFWLYADKPNEPRCSRCVTGEETVSGRHRSSRMVNLPGFGPAKSNVPKALPLAPSGIQGNSAQPGRARLTTPMWSPSRR
ncbi:unnamed protein product [Agarophyton chilense]